LLFIATQFCARENAFLPQPDISYQDCSSRLYSGAKAATGKYYRFPRCR